MNMALCDFGYAATQKTLTYLLTYLLTYTVSLRAESKVRGFTRGIDGDISEAGLREHTHTFNGLCPGLPR